MIKGLGSIDPVRRPRNSHVNKAKSDSHIVSIKIQSMINSIASFIKAIKNLFSDTEQFSQKDDVTSKKYVDWLDTARDNDKKIK